MATTTPLIVSQTPTHPTPPSRTTTVAKHAAVALPSRRQCLLLCTTSTALTALETPSRAQDIPLFGIRKGLKKAEEEAELIVKEGFEAADRGIEAAEKGIEATEKGIVTAEEEIETAVSFGGFAQAGVVGVLVTTSVVNGILGPESQKS